MLFSTRWRFQKEGWGLFDNVADSCAACGTLQWFHPRSNKFPNPSCQQCSYHMIGGCTCILLTMGSSSIWGRMLCRAANSSIRVLILRPPRIAPVKFFWSNKKGRILPNLISLGGMPTSLKLPFLFWSCARLVLLFVCAHTLKTPIDNLRLEKIQVHVVIQITTDSAENHIKFFSLFNKIGSKVFWTPILMRTKFTCLCFLVLKMHNIGHYYIQAKGSYHHDHYLLYHLRWLRHGIPMHVQIEVLGGPNL